MTSMLMPLIRRLTALACTATALWAGPALAAGEMLLREDFSALQGWTPSGKPTTSFQLNGGKLRVTNTADDFGSQSSRPVRVPATTAYRLSFTTTEIATGSKDAYFGVGLRAPNNDEVGFILSPSGYVRAYLWQAGQWATPPLRWLAVPAMRKGAGATNTVRVEREAGRFHVYVNEVLAGSTDTVDLAPSNVTLTVSQLVTVEFDDISLEATGAESRFARMLLAQPVPGAPVLLKDDFTRTMAEAMKSRISGKDVEERWILGTNDVRTAAIDRDRGAYRVTAHKHGWLQWAGGVTEPRPWAGWSMGAKIAYTQRGDQGCGGLVAIGKTTKPDADEPRLLPCYHPESGHMQLWYYPTTNDKWIELTSFPAAGAREGVNDLRLVSTGDGRLLLFLNAVYQGSVKEPLDFKFAGLGVHVDGTVGVEIDDVDCREI